MRRTLANRGLLTREQLAEALTREMDRAGMSDEKVGRATEIGRGSIMSYRLGRSFPTVDKFARLCALFPRLYALVKP